MFKNISVVKKIWLLVGTFVALLLIYGALNIKAYKLIEHDAHVMDKESVPEMVHLSNIEKHILEIQDNVSEAMLENDPHQLEEAKKTMEDSKKEFALLKNSFHEQGNDAEVKKLEAIEKETVEFYNTGVKMALQFMGKNEGKHNEELTKSMEAYKHMTHKIETELDKEVTEIEHSIDGNATEIIEQAELAITETIIMLIVVLVIGIALGVVIARNITASLEGVQQGLISFFKFLNRESAKAEPIKLDSKDEFGVMAKAVNENIARIEQEMILDREVLMDIVSAANDMQAGKFHIELTKSTTNPNLQELRDMFAKVIYYVDHNVARDLNLVLAQIGAYQTNNFEHRIPNAYGKVAVALNDLGDDMAKLP